MTLQDKHVLVTGAGKRLGLAIAEFALQSGARLSAHYHHSKAGAEELTKGNGVALPADLRDVAQIQRLVKAAQKVNGPIDVLILSAAEFSPVKTSEVSTDIWDRTLDLNLRAPFFLAQACEASLKARKGCVIALCDIHAGRPLKRFDPYVASKGGIWSLVRNLAAEWAPDVRVNSVSPGAVLPPEGFTQEQTARAIARAPLGRIGSTQDVTEAISFLLRNEYVTGFDLKVDGGASL